MSLAVRCQFENSEIFESSMLNSVPWAGLTLLKHAALLLSKLAMTFHRRSERHVKKNYVKTFQIFSVTQLNFKLTC